MRILLAVLLALSGVASAEPPTGKVGEWAKVMLAAAGAKPSKCSPHQASYLALCGIAKGYSEAARGMSNWTFNHPYTRMLGAWRYDKMSFAYEGDYLVYGQWVRVIYYHGNDEVMILTNR